jgi:YHS domain-containing protein
MKNILYFLLWLAPLLAQAQTPAQRQQQYFLSKGVALQGYDPVSYFSAAPTKGKAQFSTVYQGIKYQFATAANLATFQKSPASYEPQYGGWCAYAMGKSGEKVEVDPETYKLIDGKLYLFYNQFFNNTLTSWNKDEAKLKKQADTNWQKFIQ